MFCLFYVREYYWGLAKAECLGEDDKPALPQLGWQLIPCPILDHNGDESGWSQGPDGRVCSHRGCKSLSGTYPACSRCFKPPDHVESCRNSLCLGPSEVLIYGPYFPCFVCLLVWTNTHLYFAFVSNRVADFRNLTAASGLWTTGWVMLLWGV